MLQTSIKTKSAFKVYNSLINNTKKLHTRIYTTHQYHAFKWFGNNNVEPKWMEV